jgi:hypothetical protein
MKSIVLVVHDVSEMLPRDLQGSNVVKVAIDFQRHNEKFFRSWYLGEIEARVVEIIPEITLRVR